VIHLEPLLEISGEPGAGRVIKSGNVNRSGAVLQAWRRGWQDFGALATTCAGLAGCPQAAPAFGLDALNRIRTGRQCGYTAGSGRYFD